MNSLINNRLAIAWFVLSWLTATTALAQTKAQQIDRLLQQYVANDQFNGVALVTDQGKLIFEKAYGLANREWRLANTPTTKFRLGSITKQFTATLILQLVEQGKLRLDGKVTDYLPDYPKTTGDKITIHHLLTHTSGIPNFTDFPHFFDTQSRDPYTPQAFIKKFADLPLDFEPGSAFSYDNSGYFLLGVIIEQVTGKAYAQILREKIFTPIGMANTGYDSATTILSQRAAGYDKSSTGYVNTPYLDMSIPYASGSLYSTVEDLYRWDQALYATQLLTDNSKAKMFTPFREHYGYGWNINKEAVGADSLVVIAHAGGINGFLNILIRVPSRKQLIVLLNNTSSIPLHSIQKNILLILNGQPVEPLKKSTAESVRQSLLTDSVEEVHRKFLAWQHDLAYDLDEGEMNRMGYLFLGEGKLVQALTLFSLNVESFPSSWEVYDSRGEAYLKLGNKPAAIKDYKKSVELNPKNTNGYSILKELEKP